MDIAINLTVTVPGLTPEQVAMIDKLIELLGALQNVGTYLELETEVIPLVG